MNREELEKKINDGLSIRNLSSFFNVSYTTIRYWLKIYNLKTKNSSLPKCNISEKWSEENVLEAIKNAECKSDVLRNMGLSMSSGNFQTLDKFCKQYFIDVSSFEYKNNRGFKWNKVITNDNLFTQDSKSSTQTVKYRIITQNLLDYSCQKCHNKGEWQGEKLSLQLDHINGVNDDHRLENLRFLCPNCHAQTTTYCMGAVKAAKRQQKQEKKMAQKIINSQNQKNKRGIRKVENRPTKEELQKMIDTIPYVTIAKMYGVSDNAIKKWAIRYGIYKLKKIRKSKN